MGDTKFIYPKIKCFPYMHRDILLGNNFIFINICMCISMIYNIRYYLSLLEQHKYVCDRDFAPLPKGEMTPIIKLLMNRIGYIKF